MKEFFIPLILQLAGIIIIIAEIFLPSGGLLALLAAGLLGYSLFIVFQDISTVAGTYFILADIFIIPVLIIFGLKMLARSPATLRETLASGGGVVSQSPKLASYLGCEGKSVSALRPGGIAIIADKRVDVVSRGEYIEKDKNIVVIEVTGNQIIVRER
jgi:membrane-bound serine protease (ClpP class)